jgi:hypothetical protein
MIHFYDGQIRRYLVQTIRVLSNFAVKYGDQTLHRVPVMYGDADRQAATILRQNSENKVNSAPRISVYISGLDLDRNRLSDSSYVGKLHFRERGIDTSTNPDEYTQGQGKNYTVERLMPTPFKLTMKCDIWATNADQKLQILEQILVLFNPSLELQTTDNYIDWTSLSVLELASMNWSSKTIPVGNDSPIDVATITLEAPIWISPPAKVKHLGVITNVITSIYQNVTASEDKYIDGLGIPLGGDTITLSTILAKDTVTISDYHIQVYNSQALLLNKTENSVPRQPTIDPINEIPIRQGAQIPWSNLFNQYPELYKAGSSRLFLKQADGSDVVGTIAISPIDETILQINWDPDTYPADDLLLTNLYTGYDSVRTGSPGTFDAIIDPTTKGPRGSGLVDPTDGGDELGAGTRYLLVDDIGSIVNNDGADAWKNNNGTDFVAHANDIIEWDGNTWHIIFDSQEPDQHIYQTNIYSGIQYVWNNVSWAKSFEGDYRAGEWRIEL